MSSGGVVDDGHCGFAPILLNGSRGAPHGDGGGGGGEGGGPALPPIVGFYHVSTGFTMFQRIYRYACMHMYNSIYMHIL